jgi:hypothetical protein
MSAKTPSCSTCGVTGRPLTEPPMPRCRDWKACDARREGRARSIQMIPTSEAMTISSSASVSPVTLSSVTSAPTASAVPKKARVYTRMRGHEYYLKRVLAHTSRHDGAILWPEHLEWVAEEKEGTVFDGPEAVMLATNWGAKVSPF